MKPAQHHHRAIGEHHIRLGKDEGIEPVLLHWGESVTYAIPSEVRRRFKFRTGRKQVLTLLLPDGRDVSADVDIQLLDGDCALRLTIRPNTPAWSAKATFFFNALTGLKPASGGLDPGVANGGGPH